MNHLRLASVLTLLWAAVQAGSLLLLGFYPPEHLSYWGLAIAFLVLSGGLWHQRPWARVCLFVVGGLLLVFNITEFRYGFPCARDSADCSPGWRSHNRFW